MSEFFVGRQPIYDRDNVVFGYELLYRHSLANQTGNVNRTVATSRVMVSALVDIGLENLVGDRMAFLNLTEDFLKAPEIMMGQTSGQVVVALPATTIATAEIIAGIEQLKRAHYLVALNGYRHHLPASELLPYADLVTIDALELDTADLQLELAALEGVDVVRIAKRVDTTQRRDELAEMGFDCFQGYFMTKPDIIAGTRTPTNRVAVLDLVTKVCNPDTSSEELETLIAMDATLALRVLRFVNSPLSGLSNPIDSIHHAVVMLGRDMIKNWVMLLAISSLDDTVPELVKTAFIRAKFCEGLASAATLPSQESFFTVGLFSLMDTLTGTPMDKLLDTLPFTEEIKSALMDKSGIRGEAVLCAERLEHGAPEGCSFPDLESQRLATLYLDSIRWADQTAASVQ